MPFWEGMEPCDSWDVAGAAKSHLKSWVSLPAVGCGAESLALGLTGFLSWSSCVILGSPCQPAFTAHPQGWWATPVLLPRLSWASQVSNPSHGVFLPKCCFLRYSVGGANWWVHRSSSSTVPFTKKFYFVIFHFGRPPTILFEQRIP